MYTIELTNEEIEYLREVMEPTANHRNMSQRILDILPQKTYSIGDRFVQVSGLYQGCEYMLVHVGGKSVCLVNLTTGGHWSVPAIVEDTQNITPSEFKSVAAGDTNFEKVET